MESGFGGRGGGRVCLLRDSGIEEFRDAEIRDKGSSGIVVFLRCGHPDIEKSPVGVKVLGDGGERG